MSYLKLGYVITAAHKSSQCTYLCIWGTGHGNWTTKARAGLKRGGTELCLCQWEKKYIPLAKAIFEIVPASNKKPITTTHNPR